MNRQCVRIIIIWVMVSAVCSAYQECTITLDNDRQMKGAIEMSFQLRAAFGTCSVDPFYVVSYESGVMLLVDGTQIKGELVGDPIRLIANGRVSPIPGEHIKALRMGGKSSVSDGGFIEDFSNQQIQDDLWFTLGQPFIVKDGRLENGVDEGAGSLVTRDACGCGTYRVTIASTEDGRTFPNINYMRSSNERDWGWNGYRFYFSIHDGNIGFYKIFRNNERCLWRAPRPDKYKAGHRYIVEIRFDDSAICGLIRHEGTGYLVDRFERDDASYRSGHFALRGCAYSSSKATWDNVCYLPPIADDLDPLGDLVEFKEDFSGIELNTNRWIAHGRPFKIVNGRAQLDASQGTGSLVSHEEWGCGTYSVRIKSTSDGHSFPNINYMRSSNSKEWGWNGYRFYFSLHDEEIRFTKIVNNYETSLWTSDSEESYLPDRDYVVEVVFEDLAIKGKVRCADDDIVVESFEVQDDTFRKGYFALRGAAYSTSKASWDDVCIVSDGTR